MDGLAKPPVFVALTEEGAKLSRKLIGQGFSAQVHGRSGRVESCDLFFDNSITHLQSLFRQGHPVIGVCASGILIRVLAPVLGNKKTDPAVLALAEDGSAIIPLLGGHVGQANELANRIAGLLGINAAITTAGDLRFGVALDSPPQGWILGNPENANAFMAQLLAGASVRLIGAAPWLENSELPITEDGELVITVTTGLNNGSDKELVFHPRTIAVGVGCERNCDPDEVVDHVTRLLERENLSKKSVAGVFSIDLKSDEPAVHIVARELGVAARFYDASQLSAETERLSVKSEIVFKETGCYGVAEAAALVPVGSDGQLILPKEKTKRSTCAMAEAVAPIDARNEGNARGNLVLVGLGPGGAGWTSPEATYHLNNASDLVGYTLYLDLCEIDWQGKIRHDFPLGEEIDRVKHAIDLASQGKTVSLVCSGDPGIYAMASLVFEELDVTETAAWKRIEVTVCPGISALQGASARAGAPLGHDFCTISLSNLLTPWEVIEKRLHAAAQGDFVIAFYNPVSMRRKTQIEEARKILLQHRPADCPVIIARNLGREGEKLTFVPLTEMTADKIDMLSVVVVGSSDTRKITMPDGREFIYTPRGYQKRRDEE